MTAIARASRNLLVIRWFHACDHHFHHWMMRLYAQKLGCSISEMGDRETFIQDSEVIEWLASRYPATIHLFGKDNP